MNDDRPIEKLLRRYAKKRRDAAGEPLALHPATRRLLQGEVARRFPRTVGERKSASTGWLAVLRQRWIYATAALSVVGLVAIVLVVNDQKPQSASTQAGLKLAKNELTPARMSDKDVSALDRGAGAAKSIAPRSLPTVPASEPPASQPALAVPSRREIGRLPSGPTEAPAFGADADRQRRLISESATRSPSSVPRDAEQFARAERASAKKTPQAIPSPEAYANVALTNQAGTERFAAKSASAASVKSFADRSSPAGVAEQGLSGSLADSCARLDFKSTANPADNLPAPAAADPVAFGSQSGVATTARYGLGPREKAAEVSQAFANRVPIPVTKAKLKASSVSPVLANFQMEQAGDQLRVIDGDGSIYLGEVNPVPASFGGGSKDIGAFKREEQLAVQRATVPSAAIQQTEQDYFYRVAGTNRTLNQQVVFTWNFVALTNAPAQMKTKVEGSQLNQNQFGTAQQVQTLLQNSAINGRAQINAAKEIEINAVPVK
jgi:hypothetical protein